MSVSNQTNKRKRPANATTSNVDVLDVEAPTIDVEAPEIPLEAVTDVPDGMETKDYSTDDTDTDIEPDIQQPETDEASQPLKTKRPPIQDRVIIKESRNRKRVIIEGDREVQPPNGRIIEPGESITFEAEDEGYYVRVKQNTYQKRYVHGSSRPSFFLLYRAGQKVPKSQLVNLNK